MDELIRKLQENRAAQVKAAREALTKSAESLSANGPKEDRAAFDATADTATAAIKEIDTQIERLTAQRDSDKRAADLAAATGGTGDQRGTASGVTVTSEPTTYGFGSGHSYFLDMARTDLRRGDGDGGVNAAAARMKRHAQEVDKVMPERRAAVERRSAKAYEEAFASNPAEQRRLARMEKMGVSPFEREKRAIGRTDGQGGYFVPPLWLVDEYIPFLRAGRVFADMWRSFPLPSGTDSINIPRVTRGTATGPQVADGGNVPGQDMQDNFVNALVRTVAGQQDAAIQLLDQSPVAFDQIIFGDLMADYAMQLSGQLMLGSGVNGQLTGLYPKGTLGTTSGASASGYVVNDAADAWTAQSAANFYQSSGKLMSVIARNRSRFSCSGS